MSPCPNRSTPLRVAVVLNNAEAYARGVLRGVTSFGFARAWDCRVQGIHAIDPLEPAVPPAGIIVQANDAEQVRRLRESGAVVVNVSSAMASPGVPSVVCDDEQVGRMGAEHFIRRGFRRLVFFLPVDRQYARLRHRGFSERIHHLGFHCKLATDVPGLARLLFDLKNPWP